MRILIPVAVLLFAISLTMAPYVLAQSAPAVVVMQPNTYYDPSNCVGVQLAGGLYFCAAAPTPTPVPATSTPIPPTATVIALTPPTTGLTTINGVPLCGVRQPNGQVVGPAHDDTRWHPLVVTNGDGSVLCTYGHEHGMNPAQFDSTFGALPLDQQISYPWATISAAGVAENGTYNKHSFYKWIGATGLACIPFSSPDGSSKVVTAFREELHADGSAGATIRYHSFWGQYQITDCRTGAVGLVQVGGHIDYGDLTVGAGHTIVPVPGDPPAGCIFGADSRQENRLGDGGENSSVWYGISNRPPGCDDAYSAGDHISVALNVGRNTFGPVDPNNPGALLFFPNTANHDGIGIGTDALTVWLEVKPDASGHINFSGHVDRHGNVVPEIAGQAVGTDYIPLVIRNGDTGAYGANGVPPCRGDLQACPIGYGGDVAGPNGQLGYYVELPQ